jgi:hypothetical protein
MRQRAHLGAVGHHGALELLAEEAVQEGAQPVADLRLVIFTGERVLGDPEDLGGAEAVTDDVIQEEVVELVGSDQHLRLLGDLAVVAGREQFGADRGRHDVLEDGAFGADMAGVGRPADEVLHQGLRHADVHVIHRHVVGVERAPAERGFGKVARADDEAVALVGDVHQDLRAFAGLGVLEGDVVLAGRMLDVA